MNENLKQLSSVLEELMDQRKKYRLEIENLEDAIEQLNWRIDEIHNEMEFEYNLHNEKLNN